MTRGREQVYLCSECFTDEGLKIDAYRIGLRNKSACPNCKSKNGNKLTKKIIEDLCYRFFVLGTIQRLDYGGCPLIEFNEYNYNKSSISISPWLKSDVRLIEETIKIGLFYYSPRFWMLGEIEPLQSLQNEKERKSVIGRILKRYPVKLITKQHHFYRIRLNPVTLKNMIHHQTNT